MLPVVVKPKRSRFVLLRLGDGETMLTDVVLPERSWFYLKEVFDISFDCLMGRFEC